METRRDHILMIEDDPACIEQLRQMLAGGFSLSLARDGAGGLAAAVDLQPDLILLEARLPGGESLDVCRRLRRQPLTQDIPVIFLARGAAPEEEADGLDAGGDDFVAWPFHHGLLKARLKLQLERKAAGGRLERLAAERAVEVVRTQEAAVASLAILAEYRDHDTSLHTSRTRAFIRCLAAAVRARGVPLSDSAIEWMALTAQLHDIGKVGVPDAILAKRGRLTDEEFALVRRHPVIGGAVIRQAEARLGHSAFFQFAREIVECHHEHWDGSGYPNGLRGEEIPVSARLMTLVDVYDALASSRPYKPALPHGQVVDIIRTGDSRTRPGHFAPDVLAAFLDCHETFRHISQRGQP